MECRKKYNRQNTTKVNKCNRIKNIIKTYGNYIFSNEYLNEKLVELKILAKTDKIYNIDNHKYQISELDDLEFYLEKAVSNKNFKE